MEKETIPKALYEAIIIQISKSKSMQKGTDQALSWIYICKNSQQGTCKSNWEMYQKQDIKIQWSLS